MYKLVVYNSFSSYACIYSQIKGGGGERGGMNFCYLNFAHIYLLIRSNEAR